MELKDLNHRHEQIINWLISNPDKNQGDCARFFNYTEAWLSQIINSDMFQAQYRKRCEELGQLAVHSIHAKLAGAAALALETAVRRIENGIASERFLQDTMRTTLQGLGYGQGSNGGQAQPQKHLHLHVNAEDIARARENAAAAKNGQSVGKLNGSAPRLQVVEKDPSSIEIDLGQDSEDVKSLEELRQTLVVGD